MAYDEELAARIRLALGERADFEEIKMFGGLAFMVNTHMACGVVREDLMVRVGKENYEDARARGAQEMAFTGRPMRGMVIIPGPALADAATFDGWIDEAVAYAKADPPKPPKAKKTSRSA